MSQGGDMVWDGLSQQWVTPTSASTNVMQNPVSGSNTANDGRGYSSPVSPMLSKMDSNKSSKSNTVSERISDKGWLVSQILVTAVITLGFLMLIFSENYDYLSNYSDPPESPDAPKSSDFNGDGVGSLNETEQESYDWAYDNYLDKMEIYYDDVVEHNKLMNKYEGKAILFGKIGPGLVCLGLIYLNFQDASKEMPKGLRMALLICTFYLLVNFLGYGAGVNGGLNFGAGS
ncbi:MAG: hypothetical protein QGH90_02660 [Candidatus Poseidoniaceae archaeon]|nr:hypothetical protein [Candidatus Poseidoniaceae archaeon]